MVAMFLLFFNIGSLKYSDIFSSVIEADALTQTTATAIVAMLFIGAAGKSAQFPSTFGFLTQWQDLRQCQLYTCCDNGDFRRLSLNTNEPCTSRSRRMVYRHDLDRRPLHSSVRSHSCHSAKRYQKVLAYSTVSQLGFMFVAVGSGLYVAAIFHMITHAFFKALLFLGAGSVIHGMHHEQDMRKYGALKK